MDGSGVVAAAAAASRTSSLTLSLSLVILGAKSTTPLHRLHHRHRIEPARNLLLFLAAFRVSRFDRPGYPIQCSPVTPSIRTRATEGLNRLYHGTFHQSLSSGYRPSFDSGPRPHQSTWHFPNRKVF